MRIDKGCSCTRFLPVLVFSAGSPAEGSAHPSLALQPHQNSPQVQQTGVGRGTGSFGTRLVGWGPAGDTAQDSTVTLPRTAQ